MHYVYILISQQDGSRYIGTTKDLKRRFQEHNNGGSKYSSKKRPYQLKWYCAFLAKEKAFAFEKYLKSSSGHAFMNKRFV